MSDTFAFLRLTARQGDWQALHASLTGRLSPGEIWGTFHGLFGVGSNELIAVTVGDDDAVNASIETARSLDVDHVQALLLKPTARPASTKPLTREASTCFVSSMSPTPTSRRSPRYPPRRGGPSSAPTTTRQKPRRCFVNMTFRRFAAGCCS